MCFVFPVFSPASTMVLGWYCWSVHQPLKSDSDWNISTTIRYIATELCTAIHGPRCETINSVNVLTNTGCIAIIFDIDIHVSPQDELMNNLGDPSTFHH